MNAGFDRSIYAAAHLSGGMIPVLRMGCFCWGELAAIRSGRETGVPRTLHKGICREFKNFRDDQLEAKEIA